MNDENKTPSLTPLEKRIVKGRVISIAEDVIHLALDDNAARAEQARVRAHDLPLDRPVGTFKPGHFLDVFLTTPTARDTKLWHATALWTDRALNPWLNGSLKVGEEARGTAVTYVEDFGVIVRLKNGVEARLHRDEIPPSPMESIWHSIHLGDQILGLIKYINRARLEVKLSVQDLLRKRREEYQEAPPFADEDTKEPEISSAAASCPLHPALPFQGLHLLLIDDDKRLSQTFQEWMTIMGARVTLARHHQHLRDVLAKDPPNHILLDYVLEDSGQEQRIHALLRGRRDAHIALISGDYAQGRPFAHEAGWRFLPKPLDYAALKAWIEEDKEPALPSIHTLAPDHLWGRNVEERAVLNRADSVLASICTDTDCAAALWVRRERPGVYAVLGSHGIAAEGIAVLERQLANSLVRTVIEYQTEQQQEVHQSGPFRAAAPLVAQHIRALPVEIDAQTNDALVFFHASPFDDKVQERLREHRLRVADLTERLALVDHMREVESFAVLGRTGTGLLHEIRGAVDPLVRAGSALEQALSGSVFDKEIKQRLHKLVHHTKRVATLARMDLRAVQKQRREQIHILHTVQRIVSLMRPKAQEEDVDLEIATCIPAVTVHLPPQVLEQPLLNLLDNAIYYSRGRKWARITVSACVASNDSKTPLHILVQDHGIGMTAAQRDSLFIPRVSAKGVEGIGMGLYVSRNLLRAVGGDLVLDDTVRWLGSCFCIRLPMVLKDLSDKK